ncbi:MAG: hypothetical protein CMJ19_06400, partial [Phycisphaeraceae bacterium]|nr:hypothetical protein [Phycisphaeraceae bacterium]
MTVRGAADAAGLGGVGVDFEPAVGVHDGAPRLLPLEVDGRARRPVHRRARLVAQRLRHGRDGVGVVAVVGEVLRLGLEVHGGLELLVGRLVDDLRRRVVGAVAVGPDLGVVAGGGGRGLGRGLGGQRGAEAGHVVTEEAELGGVDGGRVRLECVNGTTQRSNVDMLRHVLQIPIKYR